MNRSNLHVTDQVREWPILNMACAHILYTRWKTRLLGNNPPFWKRPSTVEGECHATQQQVKNQRPILLINGLGSTLYNLRYVQYPAPSIAAPAAPTTASRARGVANFATSETGTAAQHFLLGVYANVSAGYSQRTLECVTFYTKMYITRGK
jgi:hypothetical protein